MVIVMLTAMVLFNDAFTNLYKNSKIVQSLAHAQYQGIP